MIHRLTLAALTAALVAGPAQAQNVVQQPAQAQPGGAQAMTAVSDELFSAAAASGGMAEVNLSRIGLQRATDPELRRFSQQMVDEHTRLNQKLLTLLAQKRIAVPQTIDARAQFCAQSLSGLSGEKFDKCYAKAQCVLHEDSLAMFEAEAHRGQDPQIKALAAEAVQHIQAHLKTIKPIAERYEKQAGSDASVHQTGGVR